MVRGLEPRQLRTGGKGEIRAPSAGCAAREGTALRQQVVVYSGGSGWWPEVRGSEARGVRCECRVGGSVVQ